MLHHRQRRLARWRDDGSPRHADEYGVEERAAKGERRGQGGDDAEDHCGYAEWA